MTSALLLFLLLFTAQRAERTRISPEALEQMLERGPVQISRAIVTGPVQLQYRNFKYEVSLTDVIFPDVVDFSYSTFDRPVTFAASTFQSTLSCIGCEVPRGLNLDRTVINNALLQELQVGQLRFSFGSVTLLNLDNAVINGNATFSSRKFEGLAVFFKTQIMGYAGFGGCEFAGEGARFEHAQFGNNLLFSPVVFKHNVLFTDIAVSGDAQFEQAVFEGGVNFQRARFNGIAFFNSARFKGDTRFPSAAFGSEAQFKDAAFDAVAEKDIVDFDNVRFSGLTDFRGSQFNLPVTFISATFEQGTTFELVNFGRAVAFNGASAQGVLAFNGSHFRDQLAFYGTSFPVITFTGEAADSAPDPQFAGPVDLRNFRYDSMTVAWRDLLSKSEYDRQPYVQMENALRAAGRDDMAEEVYLSRRIEEGKRLSGNPVRWVLDRLFYLIAGYGVRPLRLVSLCGMLLALGTWLFSRPGTVKLKESKDASGPPPRLSPSKALGVAFQHFLPGIDIPGACDWVPEANPVFIKLTRNFGVPVNPAFWTTVLLRIPGLIIIPLFLGITSGLLRTFSP